jgi:hypothetical protein
MEMRAETTALNLKEVRIAMKVRATLKRGARTAKTPELEAPNPAAFILLLLNTAPP